MIKSLENKLDALRIAGRVSDIIDNDFFTGYKVDFLPDVTINKIKARAADLSIFFEGRPVEIETSGGAVVIKVLKEDRATVNINPFLSDIFGGISGHEIPIIIGQTENGTRLYYDLVKMPHLLAAGATGSGKSVFMHNCILSSLASSKSAVVLIDVKRVEFSIYEGIPHLVKEVCYTTRAALEALQSLCIVMDKRYEKLKTAGARNITEYRENGGKMQYITVFIDELADLILSNNRIESYLVRLAQLGRAAGIHLVVATQRPDASVLSGLIRANIPSRVCFAVQKSTDSCIILDQTGGEKLRGAGDGLFMPIGSKTASRFQAPYIETGHLLEIIEAARHCND